MPKVAHDGEVMAVEVLVEWQDFKGTYEIRD